MQKDVEERLRYCQTLPTLSAVALRVIDLASNPVTDFGEVARCVNMDPALATKILRVANSPFYGKRRKSDNLRQALTLLGLDNTVTLALSFSLTSSLRSREATFFDTTYYWRRSVFSAVAARALGQHQQAARLEELFLGGLLQDIGMLVLDCVMPERYGTVANSADHQGLPEVERRSLGTDHIEVGAWILQHWQLPEYLQQLVVASHDPAAANVAADHETMTRCVALSGLLADCWLFAGSETHATRASAMARAWLNMSDDAYHGVMDAIAAALPEVSALFSIDELDPVQIAGILEHAKEILTIRNLQLLSDIKHAKTDAEALESRTRVLEVQASMDSLTGLFNRGWLDENLTQEFANATDQEWPLSVAFIDLDHFKQVNDSYGHQVGDHVLQSVAGVLAYSVRQTDLVARYGGEEFVVVFPGTGRAATHSVLERILDALRRQEYTLPTGTSIRVTASIGLATHMSGEDRFDNATDLVRAADRALYTAKRDGRNRLVVYKSGA